jgi:hypothetical protein
VRELSWLRGRAWIVPAPDPWPADLRWREIAAGTAEHRLAASAGAAEGRVAVQLVNQMASGGSYFARLGGSLLTQEAPGLVVRLRLPQESGLQAAVLAGLESLGAPERPAGLLELSWALVHEVDFKAWAWKRAAATVCRLLCADVAGMSDGEAGRLAEAVAAYRP